MIFKNLSRGRRRGGGCTAGRAINQPPLKNMRGVLLSGLVLATLSGAVEGFFTLGHLSSGAMAARGHRAMRLGAVARPSRAMTGGGGRAREMSAALTMVGDFDLSSDPFAASKKRAQTINYASSPPACPASCPTRRP